MTTPSPDAPGALNWFLILALGVVWGTAFLSVGLALEGYGPLWVAAGRTALAAAILSAGGTMLGQGLGQLASRRAWGFVTVIGAGTIAVPFLLLSWGLQHVPTAFGGVAMGAVPLLILPLVYLFSPEEGIGPRRIAGVALGFVGLALLVGPGAFESGGEPAILARFACVGAAACYAIGSILTRRAPPMPPIALAASTMLVASILLVPLALAVEGPPPLAFDRPTAAMIYSAALPTALASFLRVRVITTAGSVFMSLVSYMVPVWAVIFGITLMGEDLPPTLFKALALILAGIALSQWRSLTSLLRR